MLVADFIANSQQLAGTNSRNDIQEKTFCFHGAPDIVESIVSV
jgi:hypothetical protein